MVAERTERRLRMGAAFTLLVGLLVVGSVVLRGGDEDTAPLRPAPPLKEVLFRDDFSVDANWQTQEGRVFFRNGGLNFRLVEAGDRMLSLRSSPPYERVSVEVTARKTAGPEEAGFGIVCLAVGGENYYELLISPAGAYAIGRARDGRLTRLASGSFSGGDAWRIRADCAGGSSSAPAVLTLSVDGRILRTVRDRAAPIAAGAIGLTAITVGSGGLDVSFDDVIVGRS